LEFSGISQIKNFGKTEKINPSEDIKKKGLLSIVRHPMYFGFIMFVWCQTTSRLAIIINLILTIYVIIGTILEEKKLELKYGETYIKYQKEVPMLIPRIWSKHKSKICLDKK